MFKYPFTLISCFTYLVTGLFIAHNDILQFRMRKGSTMLKERNCVITNTNSDKREKCKGKFVPMQAMRAYGGVQVHVYLFFKAQHWVEVSG